LVYSEEDPKWRDSLKKDDRLEIFTNEQQSANIVGWTTGRVLERTNDRLSILYDGQPEAAARSIFINSLEIQPYGSHTAGSEWRTALKVGDRIDCLDTSAVWYESTVLDVKKFEEGGGMSIQVGFRVYDAKGQKQDRDGKAFMGWGHTYDEWLSIYSLRVQPRGTLARLGIYTCRKSDDNDDKNLLEDNSDFLQNSLQKKEIYGILRPERSRSSAIVGLVTIFGEAGGFDSMFNRMNDPKKPLSFGKSLALICRTGI
jgi:hypothetical protein